MDNPTSLTQNFLNFETLLLSRWRSIKSTWIDLYMAYVILKSSAMSYVSVVFYLWKNILMFLIFIWTKSVNNFWKNEPCRNIIRRKLASVVRFEVSKEFSKILIFRNCNLNLSKMRFFENSLPTLNQTTEASFRRMIFLHGSFFHKLFKLFVQIKIKNIRIFFHE